MTKTRIGRLLTLTGSLVVLSGCVGDPPEEAESTDAQEEQNPPEGETAPTTMTPRGIMSVINKI